MKKVVKRSFNVGSGNDGTDPYKEEVIEPIVTNTNSYSLSDLTNEVSLSSDSAGVGLGESEHGIGADLGVNLENSKIEQKQEETMRGARLSSISMDSQGAVNTPAQNKAEREKSKKVNSEGNLLVVEDINDIELKERIDDSVEVRRVLEGKEVFEQLVFPRNVLVRKFCTPKKPMLSIPEVSRSEWFKGVLKRHGFINPDRFKTDDVGRYILNSNLEDAYLVSRRVNA